MSPPPPRLAEVLDLNHEENDACEAKHHRPAAHHSVDGISGRSGIRASIIRWAEKQPDRPTLSEAIRRLVELGLTVRTKVKQASAARAHRAKELATKTIEKMMDPSASPEDRAQRKRRLVKGPSEFRQHRADQPRTDRK